eukprot:s6074_g3.t1
MFRRRGLGFCQEPTLHFTDVRAMSVLCSAELDIFLTPPPAQDTLQILWQCKHHAEPMPTSLEDGRLQISWSIIEHKTTQMYH